MSRTRHQAAMAALLATGLLSTGCGAGFQAYSARSYTPSDGVVGQVGALRVLNALVVAPEAGGTAAISMAVSNTGEADDELTDVTSAAGTVDLTGPRTVPAGGVLHISPGQPTQMTINGLRAKPGDVARLELHFASAGTVALDPVISPATDEYATVTPAAPVPRASVVTGPTGVATSPPTGSSSPSAGAVEPSAGTPQTPSAQPLTPSPAS